MSVVALLAGIAIFTLSGDPLGARLDRLSAADSTGGARLPVYTLVIRAISDSPYLGTGYGTFSDVFPLYRDSTIKDTMVWGNAHSTYLENMLELGIPAALALFSAIGYCGWICWRGLTRRRRNRVYPAVGLATTVLVAAHSTVDFTLAIPAVSITYAYILGVACAQSFPTRTAPGKKPG